MAIKTLTVFRRVFGPVLCLTPMLTAIGCGAGFDSPDWVKSLRVLSVQKDYPYAAPTVDAANPSEVKLTMLDYDGTQGYTAKPKSIQRLWFSGCDDLPGDQYFTCLARMNILWQRYIAAHPEENYPGETLLDGNSWSPADPAATDPGYLPDDMVIPTVSELNPLIPHDAVQARAYLKTYVRVGAGSRFTYPVPPHIIDNHRPSPDPSIPRYGLSFIFFTDCVGHIDIAPNWQNVDIATTQRDAILGFPFVCLDNDTNKALGPDDFVSGYTQEFVYGDGTANSNPAISGVSFTGPGITHSDADAGTDADAGANTGADPGVAPEAYCIDGPCVPLVAPKESLPDPCKGTSKLPRVRACAGKCSTYSFAPTMKPEDNNDKDTFASDEKHTDVGEQMWVDYYTDRGTLKHTVRLLRDGSAGWSNDDPSLGWSDGFSNQWTPPADAGPVNLWAVAHDTRGGTGWVRLQICVDP